MKLPFNVGDTVICKKNYSSSIKIMPEMSWEYAVDKIYIITFCDYWNDERTAVALAVSSSEKKIGLSSISFGSTFYSLDDKFTGAFPFAPMMF